MHTYHLFDAHHTLSRTRFLSSTISCASLVWIMDGAMVPGGADCLVPLSEVQSGFRSVGGTDTLRMNLVLNCDGYAVESSPVVSSLNLRFGLFGIASGIVGTNSNIRV